MNWHQVFQIAAVWIVSSFGLVGLWCLWCYWRNLFRRAEHNVVIFISGGEPSKPKRPDPIIPYNLKDPKTGRFISRKAAMRAALEHAVGR